MKIPSSYPIIGFDEVGRGPLAGPVVVGCVLTRKKLSEIPPRIVIRDSKTMTKLQLNKSFQWITSSFPFGIGQASALEIDEKGIGKAVVLAAQRARKDLEVKLSSSLASSTLLVDGRTKWFPNCTCIVKGDSTVVEISMAAIVAKVTRDLLMEQLALSYSEWKFEQHVGYGTMFHRKMIVQKGLIPGVHRESFCRKILGKS